MHSTTHRAAPRGVQRALAGALALGVTVALAACTPSDPLAGDDSGDDMMMGSVTIGSQGFAESEILAQIYGQVLESHGYDVSYETAIGSRETFIPALQDGSIDLIPDYAGNLLYGADPEATATSTEDVIAALPAVLEPLGLAVTDAAPGEDSDALVVTPEFAAANGLATMSDLAPISADITIGANTEFEARWRDALGTVYGIEGFAFTPIDDYGGPATLDALLTDAVQAADIYTTTPSIAENDLVVLEDDLDMFAAQNIIPLLNADLLSDELAEILDEVSALITTDELLALNGESASDAKPSAADVATGWLEANGLI